ncbi:MAG: bifunctional homocysteine S-methyltransferase/methylenetetrahydrofolate reductase [Ruminococcaceae bacterium]|nr:bifunctional homocysteine S-methyltransferase/methylenetetrahydrofolate reductase [Oscillospiraceae bacterium]
MANIRPIVFDGAFGTYFAAFNHGIRIPEFANLYDAETVLEIHREYIESGAEAIKTNTFGANINLIPDREQIEKIIRRGFEIACEAAKDTPVQVYCDIGPVYGKNRRDEYVNIADTFIRCGGTHFLFETQHEAQPLKEVIEYIKEQVSQPVIIVSFAVTQDGFTKSGGYYKNLIECACELGADFVGLNCICGPAHMLSLIKQLDTSKYSLIAMPNAGYPVKTIGTSYGKERSEYFAAKLCELAAAGVKAVGGCCGTTPIDIKAFAKRISAIDVYGMSAQAVPDEKVAARNVLGSDGTLIAVELSPPMNTDASFIIEAARKAKEAGADVITVPDSPMGSARADSLHIAAMIERLADIPTVPHICCRDKNRIAIKGGLIAANIEGVRHVLAITGDKMTETERADSKNVFNFSSYKLINYISTLNSEVFSQSPYGIYGALNINVNNFDNELTRAKRKLREGAQGFFTQPVFSDKNIENYFRAKKELGCKVFAGIMPPAGYKNALFLNNEVPGIEIPAELVESLKDKPSDEVRRICVSYACSIIDRIKNDCDGYYIMTPMKKIDYSLDIVRYIRDNTK